MNSLFRPQHKFTYCAEQLYKQRQFQIVPSPALRPRRPDSPVIPLPSCGARRCAKLNLLLQRLHMYGEGYPDPAASASIQARRTRWCSSSLTSSSPSLLRVHVPRRARCGKLDHEQPARKKHRVTSACSSPSRYTNVGCFVRRHRRIQHAHAESQHASAPAGGFWMRVMREEGEMPYVGTAWMNLQRGGGEHHRRRSGHVGGGVWVRSR